MRSGHGALAVRAGASAGSAGAGNAAGAATSSEARIAPTAQGMLRIMPAVHVTVTGYLGAGKTTVLERLRAAAPDAELIETDGLAHPAEIGGRLDDLVCAVDAKHAVFHLDDSAVCRAQIEAAGAIVLTKTDLVAEPDTRRLERRLQGLNPLARIVRAPEDALGAGHAEIPAGESGEPGVARRSLEDGELDPERFHDWLDRLTIEHGPDLFRLKGVAALEGEPRRLLVDGVHMTVATTPGEPWDGAEPRTALELAGRRLDAVRLP
jgi:G3E family GTPase